jgi:putative transposase
MERTLAEGGEKAEAIRQRLLARMGDVSEFMKTLKQRITIWYNQTHDRFGPLWADRFKSVLVEGQGNPLQTMAAYIDLNPVRAGIVEDPKDYRFCGYAEAVACHRSGFGGETRSSTSSDTTTSTSSSLRHGSHLRQGSGGHADGKAGKAASASSGEPVEPEWTADEGIRFIWRAYVNGATGEMVSAQEALRMYRELIFGKRAGEAELSEADRKQALRVLEKERGMLPRLTVLRCRVRYFTDGVILGSEAFVRSFAGSWQRDKRRKYRPKPVWLRGADWEGLTVMVPLRRQVFG